MALRGEAEASTPKLFCRERCDRDAIGAASSAAPVICPRAGVVTVEFPAAVGVIALLSDGLRDMGVEESRAGVDGGDRAISSDSGAPRGVALEAVSVSGEGKLEVNAVVLGSLASSLRRYRLASSFDKRALEVDK